MPKGKTKERENSKQAEIIKMWVFLQLPCYQTSAKTERHLRSCTVAWQLHEKERDLTVNQASEHPTPVLMLIVLRFCTVKWKALDLDL